MTSVPKGLMLIINNIEFYRHEKREGSSVDEESLRRTFSSLGFEILVRSDLTSQVSNNVLFFYIMVSYLAF